MTDLEEFESWYEDLMAWEHHQDELERIQDKDYEDNDELEMENEEMVKKSAALTKSGKSS